MVLAALLRPPALRRLTSFPAELLSSWNDAIDDAWDLDDPFLAEAPARAT
jgi:hypothetical protein